MSVPKECVASFSAELFRGIGGGATNKQMGIPANAGIPIWHRGNHDVLLAITTMKKYYR